MYFSLLTINVGVIDSLVSDVCLVILHETLHVGIIFLQISKVVLVHLQFLLLIFIV